MQLIKTILFALAATAAPTLGPLALGDPLGSDVVAKPGHLFAYGEANDGFDGKRNAVEKPGKNHVRDDGPDCHDDPGVGTGHRLRDVDHPGPSCKGAGHVVRDVDPAASLPKGPSRKGAGHMVRDVDPAASLPKGPSRKGAGHVVRDVDPAASLPKGPSRKGAGHVVRDVDPAASLPKGPSRKGAGHKLSALDDGAVLE